MVFIKRMLCSVRPPSLLGVSDTPSRHHANRSPAADMDDVIIDDDRQTIPQSVGNPLVLDNFILKDPGVQGARTDAGAASTRYIYFLLFPRRNAMPIMSWWTALRGKDARRITKNCDKNMFDAFH